MVCTREDDLSDLKGKGKRDESGTVAYNTFDPPTINKYSNGKSENAKYVNKHKKEDNLTSFYP